MNRKLQSAWVIARRDYVAAVFSRSFLFFLLGPMLIFAATGMITLIGGSKTEPPRPAIGVVLSHGEATLLADAHARIERRLGTGFLPRLEMLPTKAARAPRQTLLTQRDLAALLTGSLADPVLTSAKGGGAFIPTLGLVIDDARAWPGPGRALPAVTIAERRITLPEATDPIQRAGLARSAQIGLFFFILLLSGMLLSNFIEEKSNKVIEVLAAAVPIDSIFLGKLVGMLAISTTAIGVWLGLAGIGTLLFFPQMIGADTTPAIGWPLFCLFGGLYFIATYLLIGAVFLSIGSRAASPREVQMMSMPVTMGQVMLLTYSMAGISDPNGWMALSAAIFPWSSPLAMIGRAAMLPALWPHLLALIWQGVWLVIAIRIASIRFKRAVLNSGGGRR